ncbi:MAG: T9SS type A sorting domain-containing protein [Saprospiraceae bacterium]
MKQKPILYLAMLCLLLTFLQRTAAQDNIIMQGFYWNTIHGDTANKTTGGIWWDTIATVAPQLKNAGFNVLWAPPAQKGFVGIFDMGYGISDYYDFGQFNQFGTIRTRHGNLTELQNAITTLHANNISVMADIVLNHRAGASAQQLEDCDIPNDGRGRELRFTKFTPVSGRIAMDSSHFYPANFSGHCNLDPPYHNRIFFEDICYFNKMNNVLNPAAPNNGWYFGPHNLGAAGDSLVLVGRYMLDTIGFDMVRLDAVKHIEPGFLAPFLVELRNGAQPFTVGESFEGNAGLLKDYQQQVESFNTTFGTGSKNANMAIFDFALRFALQGMVDNTNYNMSNLNSAGLRFMPGGGLAAADIVTFVENHDFDRGGYRLVACPNGTLQIGSTCLEYFFESDHAPVVNDKHMAYSYIMAAEGTPTVFWKDYFWYGLNDEISWLIALRQQFAKGNSSPMNSLSPTFSGGSNSGDFFVLRRDGTTSGTSDGAVLGLNDAVSGNQSAWVNTPFTNKYLKDYSDGLMFVTSQAFGDSRALITTAARDFSWWAPTGLYPKQAGTAASHFTMNATPGGCPHFIALRVADAANFTVAGAPIAVGDEVAVKNTAGQVVGIGRIGQGFKWDGVKDMIIEVLGSPSSNGMANGESFRLVIYDASAGIEREAATIQFAASGTTFNFSPNRPNTPNRNGNFSTFALTSSATSTFVCQGISRITAFNTAGQSCNNDIASNTPYNNGWQTGDNGGSGFGTWTLSVTNSSNAGHFRGDSRNNGDGDSNSNGDINTSNVALGLYANNSATANAIRNFSTAMSTNSIFSLRMDNGYIDNGGSVGLGLQNSSGNNLLEFYFRGGQSFYQYNDAGNEKNTTLGFTDEGVNVQVKLLTASTYELTISGLNGGSFTATGTLKNPAGGQTPTRFRLFNFNAGSGSTKDVFFNNFSICHPTGSSLVPIAEEGIAPKLELQAQPDQENTTTQFRLYPNPVGNQLTIAMNEPMAQESQLIITDIAGRVLKIQKLGIGVVQHLINLTDLSQGSYFLTVRSDKSVQTMRFLKL